MAATALDIITKALRKIKVYASGEPLSDADAEDSLDILNDMIDSWSNESLACYAILEQSGTLQPGVGSYTIGPGGTFNLTRPLRLIAGPGAAYIRDGKNYNYPIDVVTEDTWNLIGSDRSAGSVTANIPNTLFYDAQFPLGIIKLFPAPNIAYTLFFDSYLQLVEFSTLETQINLPPGYKKAYIDNLAVQLWPHFKSGDPSATIVEDASISMGNVKRTNIRENVALYDGEIVSHAVPTFNIYTGSSSR